MDEQQTSSGAKNLADIEVIVHAGTWATQYPSKICFWSKGLYALLGVEPSAVPPSDEALMLFVHPDDRTAVADAYSSSMRDGDPFELIHRLQLPDGRTRIVLQRARISRADDGRPAEVTGILIDITSQQLMREKLDETTAKLMAVWEHVPQGLLLIHSETGVIVDANPFSVATLAWPQPKLVGQTFAFLFSPERVERARALFARSSVEPLRNIETEVVTPNADRLPIEVSTSGTFRVGENELILASFHDISHRKRQERARVRLTDTMAAMVRANAAVVRATSRDDLLHGVCEAVIGGPFCAAWVGEISASERDRVAVVARAGPAAKYVDGSVIRAGPFAESLRTVVACKVTDPWFAPWRERALSFGIQASLTLPIPYKERFPVFTIYIDDASGFSSDEIALFASLADDIILVLQWLEADDLRGQAELRERARIGDLDAALEGSLSALAEMFERRDPYTGGHQKRVAQLTRLIAADLGLHKDRARGLFLAATVHDIGKISIPAEIISKAMRLTPMEYALVQEHAEIGHGIMSRVKFPWPIAEMVYQHHEFLDGSGYPRGLSGEDILLETRILTCADIVDAMTSFRPYRRSSGLDEAIEEIAKLAKDKLDSDVVTACVRIMERGEFQAAQAPPNDLSQSD